MSSLAPSGSVARLTNSTSTITKATYVPLNAPLDADGKNVVATSGGAVRKSGYVRSLDLQTGEVDAAVRAAAAASTPPSTQLLSLLKQYEGTPIPAALPQASQFSSIPDAELIAFGNALVTLRGQALTATQQTANQASDTGAAENAEAIATATSRYNTALVGTRSMSGTTTSATSPIGMLNLERIEMTPAGIERGGLVATIPLAPRERTIVVQQEWSVITQDFSTIVTDALDNYSETGVTDTTQLAQSTNSQVAHANQFNINTSASGSIGFVTTSVATDFKNQDQNSQSAIDSRQHSVQTTQKASSRSIQSHKMTISTSTTTGSSQTNTRMLENPSQTDPMRIDYFSIMRKWYCALYRYGLRLTYDITVPEPGAAMREAYAQLDELQNSLSPEFSFDVTHSDITVANYLTLADKYSVDVAPPPSPSNIVVQVGPVGFNTTTTVSGKQTSFSVPSGYWIDSIYFTNYIGQNSGPTDPFIVVGGTGQALTAANKGIDLCAGERYLWHQSGSQTIILLFETSAQEDLGYAFFTVNCAPTDTAMAQWQSSVWTALYNAAQTAYSANQQTIAGQIAALQAQINNVDTLTLRREENDEIMKCALRWLLGKNFEFMPQNVIDLFNQTSSYPEKYGIDFTGNDSGLSKSDWSIATQNEDRIDFINQAIDWDNVIYFVYSYFWDVPESWDFVRQIRHPDATRQAFLRAGSARIVLTVRQGWELAWAYFVEFDSTSMPSPLPPHPYLTIAQQIMDYDSINYPGIPPADPDGGGPIDSGAPQVGTTSAAVLSPSTSPVTIEVADSTGFLVGTTAIIDTWESNAQENQPVTAVPDGTHITVGQLSNAHTPTNDANIPYPIVQAGESGLLIAEWFAYTPTSGTDIAVTSDLSTIT